jgi:hypothetical protein
MKTAIAFLTTTPSDELVSFANDCNEFFDVVIIADNELSKNGYIVTDDECIKNNFINSNVADASHIRKNPMAWDKVLYTFCRLKKEYDFVWIFEDDVFIPSVDSILLINKYRAFDLVVPNNFLKIGSTPDWHWRTIFKKIKSPYFYSMVCACGMSRNMLNVIDDYVLHNNELFYIESMFNTLAMQNNLDVYTPSEFVTIVWQGEWTENELLQLPNNFFHPMKESHNNLREKLLSLRTQGYKPNKSLPKFVQDRITKEKVLK